MRTNFAASLLALQCTAGKAGDEERSSANSLKGEGKGPDVISSFSHDSRIQAPLSDILLIETQGLQHPQGAILLSATKLVRHGKPSDAILQQKASFFSENQALKDRVERICQFYAAQPLRQACKNCARPLQGLS